MTDPTRYKRHAEKMRNTATVLEELDRFLGPLAAHLHPWTSTHHENYQVLLLAKIDGEVSGSTWHRAVLRLSDYFGEPFIVDDLGKLRATFTTPFDVDVVVWAERRPFSPVPAQITLAEAVA